MHAMELPVACVNACRLCDENKEKMHSVFSKNEDGQQILHLIKECLPLIIYRTDPLSKQVCSECFTKLQTFYKFKRTSVATASRHKQHLIDTETNCTKSVTLYLSCEASNNDYVNIPQQNSVSTSTEDLSVSCSNCKASLFDTSVNNEIELCAEFHKAINDSLTNNKVMQSESDKAGRSRRKRSQAFYHELDDSLCSSLTEFTNTESSQCYDEDRSEVESYDSSSEERERVKRRKIEESEPETINIKTIVIKQEKDTLDLGHLTNLYNTDVEYRYYPLSLMNLALNVVNKKIVPDHEPFDFNVKVVEPECRYCREKFKNSRVLALHEVNHINIELGEKVDNPLLWHESRDDAHIRNKWLNRYDESEGEEEECSEPESPSKGESLLIPVGTELTQEPTTAGEIVLVNGKAMVNGIPLSEYNKNERKSFYQPMKIAGANKKFCPLCRYSFKDNWAIESHYFSLACYYTCRYCGMRFNKQRHRFDEHIQEHEDRGDPVSNKIYAACKLNNFVPKVIQPEKVKKLEPEQKPLIRVKNFQRRSIKESEVKIKEEKMDSDDEKPPPQKTQVTGKTSNQAYFCRKCYKVFFKLDEFNIHSKNCDYNQFPQNRNKSRTNSNGDMLSPTGRPMRHCVREAGAYKDETYTPDPVAKEPPKGAQSFVCFICNTPFPTIYSRNSHMRIHKGEAANHKPQVPQVLAPKPQKLIPVKPFIKQEPLEPEVQIHESEQNYNSNSIGTVSITPISKNPNQKATINPNIMKLVQNNPHLTIRANRSPDRQPEKKAAPSVSTVQNSPDSDKTYKCSSCWEAFTNKSHLYFHKKNQCEGSKYPCPFCKKRFGTEAAYSSHIFYSHPE